MQDSHSRSFKPLQPAPSKSDNTTSTSSSGTAAAGGSGNSSSEAWITARPRVTGPIARPKRSAVKVACQQCRRRRIKCDDTRPRCGPCARKGETCIYDAGEHETSTLALKRKLTALRQEHLRYRDLFGILRSRTETEAFEILTRIRAAEHPLSVLEAIREAEIILPGPSFSGEESDGELSALDREAWEHSDIRVPARPWTTVAGDGLVSELVSSYFMWENAYFFPAVDREIFVHQMQGGDVGNSSWCTPLLVNSICAHRSQTLGRARIFSSMTRQNAVETFLDQAEAALRDEQGRVSIPTAQALMLRYFTLACMGRDRVGRAYRQQAIDMVLRMDLDTLYTSLAEDLSDTRAERKRVSKALWGLFVVERYARHKLRHPLQPTELDAPERSQFAYFYLQPSQISPPKTPLEFPEDESETPDEDGNVDVLGRPFDTSPCEVPHTAGILLHVGKLSELLYDVTRHNTRHEPSPGDELDVEIRKRFYARLRTVEEGLPERLSPSRNPNPSTLFLRMYLNQTGYAIVQDQSHGMLFELPAKQPGTTIKEVSLQHIRSDVEMSELFLSRWPFEACLWRHLHMSLEPLVLMLDDREAQQLFTSASAMMRMGYSSFRVCGSLLQAMEALVRATGKGIPEEARPHYEGCREHIEKRDIPLSFALPRQDDAIQLLSGKQKPPRASSFSEEDLGSLIESWLLQ